MKYAKLKLTIENDYFPCGSNYFPIEILANFLRMDYFGEKSWKKILSSKNENPWRGMTTDIYWGDNSVELSDIYCDAELESENSITIPKHEFFAILDRWEELVKQKQDEIIITQDDTGKILITGKFADGREI